MRVRLIMFPTLVLLGVFVATQLTLWALWGFLLALGLRWTQTEPNGRGIVFVTIIVALANIALTVALGVTATMRPSLAILLLMLAQLPLPYIVQLYLVRRSFRLSMFRTLQAWVPTLLAPIIGVGFVYFVLRPFLCEAFVCNGSAMAPTVLGSHWKGACPECKMPSYCTPVDPFGFAGREVEMICDRFHVTPLTDLTDESVHPADRVLTAKFVAPKRWSVVAYRLPENPLQTNLGRIVGLPGETLVIKDGNVFANDQMLTPPTELANIRYLDDDSKGLGGKLSGTQDKPAVLGQDEYFILGDFSASSFDSRWWSQGAPGRPPYAVPRSHLVGVAVFRYWPASRWGTFE